MSESLINTQGRCCRNCTYWERLPLGEHTGYCEKIGQAYNLRMCYPDKEHIYLKVKTVDFSLCSEHESEYQREVRNKRLFKENPGLFEPTK